MSAVGLIALLSSALGNPANAQLNIEIRRSAERPVPMAIVPFGWQGAGAAPFDLASVITADLRNSGRFAPIPVSDMVSRPTQPAQVNFQNWRILDVDMLVIGQLTEDSPDRYTAVFQLFDVLRGEQLLGFRLTAGRADLRATAHRIADMIFEKLTGIPGVFGTQIAYVSEERRPDNTRRFRLIVADADGENARVIADSPQPLMSPAWSPDSRRLAYVSFEGDQSAVYVQTLRTGTRDRVSGRAGVNGSPAFSPDGRQLALTLSRDQGNLDIYTLDLATQVLRQLTNDAAIDTEAVWSPDGQTIYFTSDRAGGPQIYRIAATPGGRPQRVTFEGTYNARARVSPDGKKLAVVYLDRDAYRIAVVDPMSGITQVLSNGRLDESPSFAPNGAQIIYATREGGRGVLAAVSTDGWIRQEIASVAGDVREPVWSPYPRP
ncbi:MAG TPA: Tol-Pal system beta propeller repeat protein TolB [Gammaproteobacteria bacterium]|nr:Tol-Pal system beta propeller repeat protein TolB [Gammaproteobacteria bacterium]